MDDRSRRLAAFQQACGLSITDTALLECALTHSSYINERPGAQEDDNQRLEFLGDAILDFVVGEWLYGRFEEAREGALTRLRAEIVRTESLAALATSIGLGQVMRFGHGEAASGGPDRPANLCAAFEALVGALYLDQGIDTVRRWAIPMIAARHVSVDLDTSLKDAKSRLQEHAQANLGSTPRYRIILESGPDHAKVFTAQVSVNDEVWGMGQGRNKQTAQQAAAQQALTNHVA